ncbi:hypothetical protein [Burkholderia cepacia]|uniref:hypothetical protein n=1 Tax=Burkholderia cepacia TaxID=292 RepID=UPI001C8AC82A|nr:hypothetical protein [Burkholderia cepacia]
MTLLIDCQIAPLHSRQNISVKEPSCKPRSVAQDSLYPHVATEDQTKQTLDHSLVLESYGGISRKFDVALGLEYIAGIPSKALSKLPKTQQAQMRNLYVAMSRPTTLLCLAANDSRVPQKIRDALAKKGWQIQTVP